MISNNNVYFCKLNNKSPLKICVMDKRFDLNTDKELAHTICEEINRQFWKLERHVDGDDLSAQALEERLSSLGYEVSCEQEKTRPYHYYYDNKDFFFVAMNNMDFCVKGRQEDIELIFARLQYRGSLYISIRNLDVIVDFLVKIDNDMPKIIKRCTERIYNHKKTEKMRALSKATMETVIKETLKNTGILYKLDLNDQRAFLTLKLDRGLETKFNLSYKSFMDKIPYVVSTVRQLNAIMNSLDQPLRVKTTYHGDKDKWEESK